MKAGNIIFIFGLAALLSACSQKEEPKAETQAPASASSTTSSPINERASKAYLADCKELYAKALHMDSVLLEETSVNFEHAKKAIEAFSDFAYYCKSDSMAPVYLIKTAQVARSVDNIPQAKQALDHCIENYIFSKHRVTAIFLLAQLYDEPGYLNDEGEARKLYQLILSDYPKSDWAASAKGAMQFLGKTDEEIMQELKKKNKIK